ncbi:MAG: hypothetical protein K0S08_1585 [Gammaproteobacteria bacterium]|nr:hypothetical protein [Gammaproteobacteria bacterium]
MTNTPLFFQQATFDSTRCDQLLSKVTLSNIVRCKSNPQINTLYVQFDDLKASYPLQAWLAKTNIALKQIRHGWVSDENGSRLGAIVEFDLNDFDAYMSGQLVAAPAAAPQFSALR